MNHHIKNTKKSIILSLLLSMILTTLCGCSADPLNFTVGDLTITLTKNFEESAVPGFDVYIISDHVSFSAVEETSEELEIAGYEITSLNDYALEILELNGTAKSELQNRDNYLYFVNSKTVSGAKYTYVHCLFEDSTSYWVCEFVCKSKDYDKFKDNIFEWADTIQFK